MKLLVVAAVVLALAHDLAAQSSPLPASQFFESNGVRIRFVDQGRGEPLVLVHGLLGDVESNWYQTDVLERLVGHLHVIALDMRGHGKSEKPHDPAAYGSRMAEDIVRLLDHLKLKKAHILGYSLGGAVVGKLLVTHPDRVASAIFGGSAPWIIWTDADDRNADVMAREFEEGSLRDRMTRNVPPGQVPSEDEIKARSAQVLAGQDRFALAAVVRSYRQLVVTDDEVSETRVPMLAVIGSEDKSNMRDVEMLKKVRPTLNVVVIEGATHNEPRNARARPEFAQAVRQFVVAHSGARPSVR